MKSRHELHNDFMVFWHDYKQNVDIDGPGGVLEQSVKLEAAADETGARLMYAAGWDPNGMVELFKRFHKFGVMARHGRPDVPVFASVGGDARPADRGSDRDAAS